MVTLHKAIATARTHVARLDALMVKLARNRPSAGLITINPIVREWMAVHGTLVTTRQILRTASVASCCKVVELSRACHPDLSLMVLTLQGEREANATWILVHDPENFPPQSVRVTQVLGISEDIEPSLRA